MCVHLCLWKVCFKRIWKGTLPQGFEKKFIKMCLTASPGPVDLYSIIYAQTDWNRYSHAKVLVRFFLPDFWPGVLDQKILYTAQCCWDRKHNVPKAFFAPDLPTIAPDRPRPSLSASLVLLRRRLLLVPASFLSSSLPPCRPSPSSPRSPRSLKIFNLFGFGT